MSSNDNEVIGLKTQVKRQVGLKNYETQVGNHNRKCMVDAWKCMYNVGIRNELIELIWRHISDENGFGNVWFSCMSADVGLMSVIKPYTNKKGQTQPAHFSINDKYIGSVSKLGNKPISYEGHFLVKRETFNLNLDELPNLRVFNGEPLIQHLFIPKNKNKKVVSCDDDDEDEPIGNKLVRQSAILK